MDNLHKKEVHYLDVELAIEHGERAALVLNHFIFWIKTNKRNGVNFHDGYTWTYQKLDALCLHFPYLSRRQIERVLDKLEKENIIKKGNYNKSSFDRTVWYTIADKKTITTYLPECSNSATCISPNGEMGNTKRGNGEHQTVTTIPDNTTDNTTDNNLSLSNDDKKNELLKKWFNYLSDQSGKTISEEIKKTNMDWSVNYSVKELEEQINSAIMGGFRVLKEKPKQKDSSKKAKSPAKTVKPSLQDIKDDLEKLCRDEKFKRSDHSNEALEVAIRKARENMERWAIAGELETINAIKMKIEAVKQYYSELSKQNNTKLPSE